jgi:mono/diheme cytochrome c family protein
MAKFLQRIIVLSVLLTGNFVFAQENKDNFSKEQIEAGKKHFQSKCAPCHGQKGEGIIGPAVGCHGVKNKTYKFLYDVIYHGRIGEHGIDMPSWGVGDPVEETDTVKEFKKSLAGNKSFSVDMIEEFTKKVFGQDSEMVIVEKKGQDIVKNYGPLRPKEIREVIAYLRNLEQVQEKEPPAECLLHKDEVPLKGSLDSGKKIFNEICNKCHGKEGKVDSFFEGKDLSPRDFSDKLYMASKTDAYLKLVIRTGGITQGRSGIMSPIFLTDQELTDVITYIRTLSEKKE